ncbi:DUF4225 domain-containing protein [Pseudomonas sp. C5pp]|uniref:DUF4225 domain-containing protein n=1 Tax=Pseudomonas sp. C5pp TaxID=1586081 RepID=UPI00068A0B28|nr:DUF4225 domain-containing protein [Pseudomonas sp. C5pp]
MSRSDAGGGMDDDFWEVSSQAARLTQYACEVGAHYIGDDILRARFVQEIAYVGKAIVDDVSAGRVSAKEGQEALEQEYLELLTQVWEYSKLVAGVTAGILQVHTGAAVCGFSLGVGCLIGGVPMMLHGANNIYENGLNIFLGQRGTVGPIRKAYQRVAVAAGGTVSDGNVAYGTLDLGLSAYNLGRLVLRPGAWRLFRYVRADKTQALKTMSTHSIVFEVGIDMLTGEQVRVELRDR